MNILLSWCHISNNHSGTATSCIQPSYIMHTCNNIITKQSCVCFVIVFCSCVCARRRWPLDMEIEETAVGYDGVTVAVGKNFVERVWIYNTAIVVKQIDLFRQVLCFAVTY